MKNQKTYFTLLIGIGVMFLINSCSQIRFENNGIVIEAEIDGETYPMIMFNTKIGLDILDESTFDKIAGFDVVAGKLATEIRFSEDPASRDYKNTNPREPVTLILYNPRGFDQDYKEEYKVAQVKTDGFEPNYWYYWNMKERALENLGKIKKIQKDYDKQQEEIKNQNTGTDPSNPLIGKWMNSDECTNLKNEGNWFQFNSNGTGIAFSTDCNSQCAGYGITTFFNYTYTNSKISVTYTKADPYCGIENVTPNPNTASYSISGNTLTISGVNFIRQ